MADRALSYGETIQWDSDSSKMFALRNGGTVIMFAGEEEPISRLPGKVIAKEMTWQGGHYQAGSGGGISGSHP
jgi:hypothetical protein